MTRLYQPVPLSPNQSLTLNETASHHLARVLRATVGDELIVFNGEGGEYSAVITRIDKKSVHVQIKNFSAKEVESPLHIHLAQGLARGEKMDFIVQKAVELGVTSITPLFTSRCNVKVSENRMQHWQAVIVSACEQSGRNRVPLLQPVMDFKTWLPEAKGDYRFVLSPHVEKKLPDVMETNPAVVLLIGPEGGFSEDEMALAIKNGFIPLNLGKRILRTETASLAAIAALQARFGDFCI